MDNHWLPLGRHWGLTISHAELEDAGNFVGGGHKLIWHTTEGRSLSGAFSTLRDNRDAPHVIIDPFHDSAEVIQTIPFNRAARALAHPFGPETNRANCIQVEIVGLAAHSGDWGEREYDHLGALAALIKHRVDIPNGAPLPFIASHRMTGMQFYEATGHFGHCHVPGNDHTDPGAGFTAHYLLDRINRAERVFS
jgi:hypothetical protein